MTATCTNLVTLASKRSAYISHLRRAFLLRAHPDRFRSHPDSIRKTQAQAIHAFQERILAPDFVAYKSPSALGINHDHDHDQNPRNWNKTDFHLETKNGSLKRFTLSLGGNVEQVLLCLSEALKATGMSVIKPPPDPPLDAERTSSHFQNSTSSGMDHMDGILRSTVAHKQGTVNINSIFDINTRKGRDLMHFLSNLDMTEIEQRKASRIDASAAALIARQAYKFQVIDGTGLGWSSASLAKCLVSLTKLHDEHCNKFNVSSFYPLRLVLSNDEFQDKVDLFSGTVMLNPIATQIQWLETLMSVSEESLKELEQNRGKLLRNQTQVQSALNIQMKKGFSCTGEEYQNFMAGLSAMLTLHEQDASSTALTPERIQVVVETAQACRRAVVTSTGVIRVSTGMPWETIISSVHNLRTDVRQKHIAEKERKKEMKELESMVQYDLGAVKISIARFASISSDQYLKCLNDLLRLPDDTKSKIKHLLAGQSLTITGRGRSCHLGDDGAITVPVDWN